MQILYEGTFITRLFHLGPRSDASVWERVAGCAAAVAEHIFIRRYL